MKEFVRASKLSNVKGRAEYITDPKRQEDIVAVSSQQPDWTAYADYERDHQRSAQANNEGRELIIALPNEWRELPVEELTIRVDALAVAGVGKDTDWQWAVHNNAEGGNLHTHIIFSERQRLLQQAKPRRYDRDIYLSSDGKVARRAADRARDGAGAVLPPVHRKGDAMDNEFSPKDPRYAAVGWATRAKASIKAQIEAYGVVYAQRAAYEIKQRHQGKGPLSDAIADRNWYVQVANKALRLAARQGAPLDWLMEQRNKTLDMLGEYKHLSLQAARSAQDEPLPMYGAEYARRVKNAPETDKLPVTWIQRLNRIVQPKNFEREVSAPPDEWFDKLEKAGYIKVDRSTGDDTRKWIVQTTPDGLDAYQLHKFRGKGFALVSDSPLQQRLARLTPLEREMHDSALLRNQPVLREQYLKLTEEARDLEPIRVIPREWIKAIREFREPQRGLEKAPDGLIPALERAGYIVVDRSGGDISQWTAKATESGMEASREVRHQEQQMEHLPG